MPVASLCRGLERFADAVAVAEGYGVSGSLPSRRNNPGSLTADGQLISFSSAHAGRCALVEQLRMIYDGLSGYYYPGMTIREMGRVWSGSTSGEWSRNVAGYLGVPEDVSFARLVERLSVEGLNQ